MKNFKILILSIMVCFSLSGCNKLFHSDKKVPNINQVNKIEKQANNNNDKKAENGSTPKKKKNELINKSQEEKEVKNIFLKYISAINSQDILNTMNCIDPYRKDYEEKRMFFDMIFNDFDIKYATNNFKITIIDSNNATVDVDMQVTNGKTKQIKGKIELKKVKGLWRIAAENIF